MHGSKVRRKTSGEYHDYAEQDIASFGWFHFRFTYFTY